MSNQPSHLTLVSTHRAVIVDLPDDHDGMWAMPTARAATASQPSLLRVSGIAGIAIAAFCVVYFGAEFLR